MSGINGTGIAGKENKFPTLGGLEGKEKSQNREKQQKNEGKLSPFIELPDVEDAKAESEEHWRQQKEDIENGEDRDASEAIKEYLKEHNVNKQKPAYLVRGAELVCSLATNARKMNLGMCHGVYIKDHAVVHEYDCKQGEEENITWFGVCTKGEGLDTEDIKLIGDDKKEYKGKKCKPFIIGRWMEPYAGTRIVDSEQKEEEDPENPQGCQALTMDSFLVCKYGGIIMPVNSGQDREVTDDEFVEGKEAHERVKGLADDCEEEINREEG